MIFFESYSARAFIHPSVQQSRGPQNKIQILEGDQTKCLADPDPCQSLNELVHEHTCLSLLEVYKLTEI